MIYLIFTLKQNIYSKAETLAVNASSAAFNVSFSAESSFTA